MIWRYCKYDIVWYAVVSFSMLLLPSYVYSKSKKKSRILNAFDLTKRIAIEFKA